MIQKQNRISLEIGANPNKDEISTVNFLVKNFGGNILFLSASETKGVHTPDILWRRHKWEIKTPRSNGKFTIEHAIQEATKQSENIIIDLRSCKMPEEKSITKIRREFKYRTKIRRLLIIRKSAKTLDLNR